MQKLLISLAALLATLTSGAETSIKADAARYCGRVCIEDGSVSFDWSGVCATVAFEGTSLCLKYSDTGCNRINVWIDREPDEKADTVLVLGHKKAVLAECLPPGRHTVTVQKRTEGEQGRLSFHTFTTDGRFLNAGTGKDRLIEFVGDSYTCGYGTESLSGKERFSPVTENCNLTYAAVLGRSFGCDIRLISHSGRGVVRNYGGYDADLPMRRKYAQTFDCDSTLKWKPSEGDAVPQLVVIYLGTNDFSCGEHPALDDWCEGYLEIIDQAKAWYGEEVPVLCVASKSDARMVEYVREVCRRCPHSGVHATALFANVHNDNSELGADQHPNYDGQRKVAAALMPYVSTLTGWAMPESIR